MAFALSGFLGSNAEAIAADPAGKLWIERDRATSIPDRQPLKRAPKAQPQDPNDQAPARVNIYDRGTYDRGAKGAQRDPYPYRGQAAPYEGQTRRNSSSAIERQSLPPVSSAPVDSRYGQNSAPRSSRRLSDKTGFQQNVWRKMSFDRFQSSLLKIDGSGRSPALNDLLVKALLDRTSMPQNADPQMHDFLKMIVLYRMGRIKTLLELIEAIPVDAHALPVRIFYARALLAHGRGEEACRLASRFPVGDPDLSKDLLSEVLLMTALCAAQKKDLQTVGLMADLARDKGVKSPISFAVMDFLISGVKPRLRLPAKLGVRDYFFLRLTDKPAPRKLIDMAEPALVYALAYDRKSPSRLRLEAAERAAKHGQIEALDLAAIYSEIAAHSVHKGAERNDSQTRALLFDALSRTHDPQHRAKIMDTLLANARKVDLALAIGPMLLPYVKQMNPGPSLAWFAMRAVEVALLARDMPLAEQWLSFVKQGGREAYAAAEWLPLVDLVQKGVIQSGEGAQMAMRMARVKRLKSTGLHRLTSTLDALDFEVPIPLWNEAGKLAQPQKGALPPSGALSRLKKASDEGRTGEVLLQSLLAVGAHSADEMHLIALGDIVKSLKKAGFDHQAGLFGFEALYGVWPTGLSRVR